jgi:hypothetical protein
MSNLQARLDEFKRTFESGAPPYHASQEAVEAMHRATAELKASGAEGRASRPETGLPASRCSTRITYRWLRPAFSAKDHWWSASFAAFIALACSVPCCRRFHTQLRQTGIEREDGLGDQDDGTQRPIGLIRRHPCYQSHRWPDRA